MQLPQDSNNTGIMTNNNNTGIMTNATANANANANDHANYYDDDGFSGYLETTNNPGWPLLVATLGYCLSIYFVCWVWIMKKRRVDRAMTSSSSASSTSLPKQRRSNPTEKDIKDVAKLTSYVAFGNKDHLHAAPPSDEMKTKRTDRPGGAGHHKYFGIRRRRKASAFDEDSVLTFENYFGGKNILKKGNKQGKDPLKVSVTFDDDVLCRAGCSDYDPMEEMENVEEMMNLDENMKEIHRLAGPWIFGSIVGQLADIATITLIAFYIGNDSMIAYITIEFLLSVLQLLSYGVYDACYKLANIAISSGNEDRAGKIAKVSICLSILTSLPALIVSIFWMKDLLLLFGYGQFVCHIGPKYAIMSSLMSLMDSSSSIISALVDLNGGANFNSVYDFWDSVINLVLTFVAVAFLQQSLFGLGILWLVIDVASAVVYVCTVGRKGFLKPFFEDTRSHFSFLQSRASLTLLSLILQTSLPHTLAGVASDLEFRVLSVMAAELGAAEAATWILLSYVWSSMECGLDSFSSAAATQVNSLLTKGDIVTARRASRKARAFALLYGTSVALIVYATKDPIANVLTSDYTLQSMLVDCITFACVGAPFAAIGGMSEEMNKEQGRYRTSMAISWCCSLMVTIPVATVMTFGFRCSVAAIVSAVVMGSTTDGMLQTVLLVYSNFHSASNSLQEHANDDLSTVDDAVQLYEGVV